MYVRVEGGITLTILARCDIRGQSAGKNTENALPTGRTFQLNSLHLSFEHRRQRPVFGYYIAKLVYGYGEIQKTVNVSRKLI
ncbi:MAG: hypothetical protein K0Q63_1053 [Paenibacillus sp.]|nr:hypothetical protein [Paenibacillus sp.]